MTTSPEWRKVEEALDHLTSELLRLQQQETPWLMTVQEQSDLAYTIHEALEALKTDMEPTCDHCGKHFTNGIVSALLNLCGSCTSDALKNPNAFVMANWPDEDAYRQVLKFASDC